MTTLSTIIKYEQTSAGDIKTRAIFNYEFPQKIYAVLE